MLIIKMTVATYNYWEPLANEGIADAQLGLGILYVKG